MCPNCGKRLKMGCGGMIGIALAYLAVIGAIFVVGGILLLSNTSREGHASTGSTKRQTTPVPAPAATGMPAAEVAFVTSVQSYVDQYEAAPNELVKTALRTERRTRLSQLLPERQVSSWVGTLKDLSTDSDGKASASITLDGSAITVHTDPGNPFKPGSDTSVEHGSPLYNQFAKLTEGEKVKFSGSFLPDERDHLRETSFTESGAMTAPEFVMRFSEVTAASTDSSSPPGVSPTSVIAQTKKQPRDAVLPPAIPSPTSDTTPKPLSSAGSSQVPVPPQANPVAAPNFPMAILIRRKTTTTEHDAPGDVLVTYTNGTSRWLTDGENSSQAKFSLRNSTIGWVVKEVPTNRPGDGYTMSYDVRPCHTLVLYRDGRTIATLQSKLMFIEEWGFEDADSQVVLRCRQSHGEGLFQLFDVESGKLLATAAENDEPLPSWVPSSTDHASSGVAPMITVPTLLARPSTPQATARPTTGDQASGTIASNTSKPPVEPSPESSEALLIGKWQGERHVTEYRLDHTRIIDGAAYDPRRTWSLLGDVLVEGKSRYRVVTLDQGHLVLAGDQGQLYRHDRILPTENGVEKPMPLRVSTSVSPMLRLKMFEDEGHTCRLLLTEDGWVPIEAPEDGVRLALEGPGGVRLNVRPLDGAVGERSLAVMFARAVKEHFPFGDMEINPTKPEHHSTVGKRTVLSFSAQTRNATQQMLEDLPDGPMKQGLISGDKTFAPRNLTCFVWVVFSEDSATWVVEIQDTISVQSPSQIKSKTDSARIQFIRKKFNLAQQFENDPVGVYTYIRGSALGRLEWAIVTGSVFDADGLTPVIDQSKQAADPKVAETWNLFMDAQTW